MAHKISKYSGAKSKIKKQARADKAAGKTGSDLESFMAVEQIKKMNKS